MRRSPIFRCCASALALAACGSGGSKGAIPASSSTSAPSDPVVVADRKLANATVIRPADLPGWQVTPRKPSQSSEIRRLASGIPGCEQFVAGIRDGRVTARSPKFTQPGRSVDGDIDVYATPAEVQGQLELYRDPTIVSCLQNLFTKALTASAPSGATVSGVSVSPIAVDAAAGDGTFGFRITANVTRNGTAQTILSDIVGVAVGRVGASLTTTASNTADLAQVETTLLPLVAQRARDAGD